MLKTGEGDKYKLKYKPHTWFETTRQKQVERKSFESLAKKLNLIEGKKRGTWKVVRHGAKSDWDYHLEFSNENFELSPGRIKVFEMENILFEYFFE